jgi:YbgC/YbaW family acyl-CoA thioester hydrolase
MAIEHTERMRVNWVDTDASGRIHYTAALRYFEVPEHAVMREIFGNGLFEMPRVHVEADYQNELRYPDEFDCTARIVRVGRTSVHWEYEIVRADGVRAITGKIVAVGVGPDGRPAEIPDALRRKVEG